MAMKVDTKSLTADETQQLVNGLLESIETRDNFIQDLLGELQALRGAYQAVEVSLRRAKKNMPVEDGEAV
jgi:hypothetical protein